MKNLAEVLPEPPNGSRVVIESKHGFHSVLWRDDEEAAKDALKDPETLPGERWYEAAGGDGCSFPMAWERALEPALAVYAVSTSPLASR